MTDLHSRPVSSTGADPGARLRLALWLDVALTGANAIGYLALAQLLDSVLDVSSTAMYVTGVFLAGYTAAVWLIASRSHPPKPAVLVVIAANLSWAVGSLVLAAAHGLSPSGIGTTWIVLQAVVVGAFGLLQWTGLAHRERSNPLVP